MAQTINKWPSLDILRGIAVMFMLLNHAAVYWLTPSAQQVGFAGAVNFIGSFAPVLFFFTTGVGYGLAHTIGRRANTLNVLVKAGILIVADIFLRGGNFTFIGWDFLAFIAFSMVVLHGFRGRRFALPAALVLIGLLLMARFALGAFYERSTESPDSLIQIILGMKAMNGVSYWFTPWLIYPLAGFIVGALAKRYSDFVHTRSLLVIISLLINGLFIAALSFVLFQKGASLFRWGTMSLNFFIASMACLSISTALALIFANKIVLPKLSRAISMQGVSSLAVVPLHYFFIALIDTFSPLSLSPTHYLLLMPVWLMACMFLAKQVDVFTRALSPRLGSKFLIASACFLGVLAIITSLTQDFNLLFVTTFIAQLLLCFLLGFSYSKRT